MADPAFMEECRGWNVNESTRARAARTLAPPPHPLALWHALPPRRPSVLPRVPGARGAVVFQPPNWQTFSGMMRDDFTLFDSFVYMPPPPHIAKGEFPVPIKAKYAEKDGRCKKHHLEMWKAFTSEKLKFTAELTPGNHLFFYDVPARATWMHSVLKDLPDGFGEKPAPTDLS